jgi:excisionase family DNA binding protein
VVQVKVAGAARRSLGGGDIIRLPWWPGNRVRYEGTKEMERLLRVEEAAEYLATTKSTLYSWASRRKIPVVKIGRSPRFRLSELDRLIKAGERPALRPLGGLRGSGDR